MSTSASKVASLLKVLIGLSCVQLGHSVASGYGQIDAYLVENVDTDDVGPNMKEATEWLNSKLKLETNSSDQELLRSLREFTSLARIDKLNRCNMDSFKILLQNDKETHGRAHRKASKLGRLRRVEKIVQKYGLQHAKDCASVYPVKFKNQYRQMDQWKLYYVETMLDRISANRKSLVPRFVRGSGLERVGIFGSTDGAIGGQRDAKVIFQTLVLLAMNDPDKIVSKGQNEKLTVSLDQVSILFSKYLLQPCIYYVNQLADIFVPAEYDTLIFKQSYRDEADANKFKLARRNFKLCSMLINRDNQLLLEAITELAAKNNL